MNPCKLLTLGILVCLLGLSSASASSATSAKSYCALTRDDFIHDFAQLNKSNRLAFENPYGKLHMGLCWWHSLFQRSAVYLTVFRPDLPKPTHDQVVDLIKNIIGNKKVVEVPGYPDLQSFSDAHEKEIEDELSNWQIIDGFLRQKWIVGIHGKARVSGEDLERKLDRIYKTYRKSDFVQYTKIKIQGYGLDAHALLIIGMRKTPDGYDLETVDSNFPEVTVPLHYRRGDTSLIDSEFELWEFVPYLEHQGDLKKITRAMKKYCAEQGGSAFASEKAGETPVPAAEPFMPDIYDMPAMNLDQENKDLPDGAEQPGAQPADPNAGGLTH